MDHIADVKADTDLDLTLTWSCCVILGELLLDLNRTEYRFESARKLNQEAVAGRLDLTAAMFRENRAQNTIVRVQQLQRQRLVFLHQSAVATDICEHDRCQCSSAVGIHGKCPRPSAIDRLPEAIDCQRRDAGDAVEWEAADCEGCFRCRSKKELSA